MKKKSLNTRLYLSFLISLIPLIIYGFYKNGIKLFYMDIIGPIEMFRPIFVLVVAILGASTGGFIRERKYLKKERANIVRRCRGSLFEAVVLSSILPLNVNLFLVFAITFLVSLTLEKVHINKICLMFFIIYAGNHFLNVNEFRNPYELTTALNYDGLDIFLGRGIGGIFSSSALLIVLAIIFLSFNKMYKKELVYSSVLTFVLLGTIPFMIKGEYASILPFLCGYNFLFSFAYISPNLYCSCYTVKGQILSGIAIALITYLLSFWFPYLAAIIAIMIVSLSKNVIDRIFIIK